LNLEWLEDRLLPSAITFAQFSQVDPSQQNFSYSVTVPNNTPTAQFNTGTGGNAVSVGFDSAVMTGLSGVSSPQPAHLFLTSSTTSLVTNNLGFLSEEFATTTNTLQITLDTPVNGQSNFLTVTYTDSLSGISGGQSGSLTANTNTGTITYTSDFADFSSTTSRDFNLTFSSIQPALQVGAHGLYAPFTTSGNGAFDAAFPGVIQGEKFQDTNGNGTLDAGEPGLQNWTIDLIDPGTGNVLQTTTTDVNGNYSFTGLPPGTYRVREEQQTGWTQTTANPADITLGPGQDVTGINFGNFQLGQISGLKFQDSNGNGIQDSGEPGLQNWVIDLTNLNTGAVQTATTDSNGDFSFTGLGPGTYRVREEQQTGWTQTTSDPADIPLTSGADVTGVDFGNFQLGQISGLKFQDTNGNGVQDTGEPGLQNWTIDLTNLGTGTVQTATTDANGNYSFTGLLAGTYQVSEEQQTGWTQTTSNPAAITVTSGTSVSGIDFGNFQLGQISGLKFQDTNGNGTQDSGEPALPNWTIDLTNLTTGTVQTATTDGNGNYSFTGLGTGTYRVREEQQTGWTQTSADPADITLTSGANLTGIDFGNFQLGQISGLKFQDTNGNGTQDSGEPALPNWTIDLTNLTTGTVQTATTDGNGNYSFTGLGPGTYRVREEQQAGWMQTTVDPADITLTSGANLTGIDFGNFQLAQISGLKFQDTNANGVQDNGEPGLQNWVIDLTNLGTGTVQTATTDANGNYSFTGVGPGTYRIREEQQTGWMQTTANPTDFTLTSGANVTGIDFGNFQLGVISGLKFQDTNGDGIQDNGEPGLENWTIDLIDPGTGNVLQTATTDPHGNYSFTGLVVGTYRVREVQQAGWTQTTANPADITVTSGTNASAVNFGNFPTFPLGQISGLKFQDTNGDGTQESGEPGLPNWTIDLVDPVSGIVMRTAVTGANGTYSFTNVAPGSYRIREEQQTGWMRTTANPADITVTSGANITGIDFGNFQLAEIQGEAFQDTNGDRHQQPADPGLAGWTIDLLNATTGALLKRTTTDSSGNYAFTNLGAGNYRVREQGRAGWIQTTVNPADATLVSGTVVTGVDFGNFQLGQIHGLTFQDTNGDGVRQPGEPGLASWTIDLISAATGHVLASTHTDPSGHYSFTGLLAGTYRVREVPQAGWIQSTVNPGPLVIRSGSDFTGIDFGNFRPATITGQKFLDLNGNGRKDPGEPGLPVWTIQIIDVQSGRLLQTTTTDAHGNYRFTNLAPGSYHLREVLEVGYQQTSAPPADIQLGFGATVSGVNFGNALAPPTSKLQLLAGFSAIQLAADLGFLTAVYQQLLNRRPDINGLYDWALLLQEGVPRQQVVSSIWASAEHRSREVDQFYAHFLGRPADAAGRAAWVDTLLSGASENDVIRAFLTSPEYNARHPGALNFLGGLYADVLGRSPDGAGQAAWMHGLQSGLSEQAVAEAFLVSEEAERNLIVRDYTTFLGRLPDAAGEATWLALLQSGQADAQALTVGFLSSDEYFARFQPG
jgi:protocatechuate 3,4-dioxygenase beta subunit